ncbi:DUF2628 domain-containing protein [Stenotrophomonas sp.]|uniref:DUF2628 domain-containing protein n=1 Tax=Stenotrophomonas sp. TaxID=69392 RepID=UPI00289EEAAC|nr:DUF2628 domain-containing protein [Stenotrophomonas sp.]
MNAIDLSRFSAKWQFRFNFYQQHGSPKDPRFAPAWKALPVGERLTININFLALFFSWIYLLTLGMWRKALVVIAIFIGLFALAFVLPTILVQGLIGGFCALLAHCTNYGYYLEQVKGRTSWNPFDGFI